MKDNTHGTRFTRPAVAALALLLVPAAALAQVVIFGGDREGGFENSFFLRRLDGPGLFLLGGNASAPVTINMDGPGLLITCGQESSGGASVAYEFIPTEPDTTEGPDARAEAAIRRLSEEFARGEPNYDLMTPCMAGTARSQLESLRDQFESLGPVETVTFNDDWSSQGVDSFDVEYADGSLRWVIALTSDGKAKMWMFHEIS